MIPVVAPLIGSIGSGVVGGLKKLFGGRTVTLPPGATPPPIDAKTFPGGSFFDIGEVAPNDHALVDSRNGNVYVSRSGGVYQITGAEAAEIKKWWISSGAKEAGREHWLYRSDGALAGQRPAIKDIGGEFVFDLGINPAFQGSGMLMIGVVVMAVALLIAVFRK